MPRSSSSPPRPCIRRSDTSQTQTPHSSHLSTYTIEARSPNAFLQALRGVGGIILNAEGQRFCNELGRRGLMQSVSESVGVFSSCFLAKKGRDYVTGEMWKSKPPFRCLAARLCEIGRLHLFLIRPLSFSCPCFLTGECSRTAFLWGRLCLNKAASDEIIWHCKPRTEQTVSTAPTDPYSRLGGAACEALHWARRGEHSRLNRVLPFSSMLRASSRS